MWFRSLIKSLVRSPRYRRRRAAELKQMARRLLLEGLEDRRVMAFVPAVSYPVGPYPYAVITADFNNDGRLDLATANNVGSNVSVLLGNPDGTFQAALTSPTGTDPQSLAVGDFDGDGKLDLATANTGDVSILKGNGLGGFAAPSGILIDSNSHSVAVGDFNADGKMDLTVGGHTSTYIPPWGSYGPYGWYGGGGYWVDEARISVLLGNGTGGFGAPTSYDLGSGATTAVAVSDLNGDGKADVVAASGSVFALLGNGNGTLQPPRPSGYGTAVAIADINGDGKLDLATTGGGSIGVALGDGLGTFAAAQYFVAGTYPNSVAVADFNGDGRMDLAASDHGSSSVQVLLNAGVSASTVSFKPPVTVPVGTNPFAIARADFNGDGRADLAIATSGSNNISVLLNDSTWPALNAPSINISDAATVTEGNTGTVNANFTVSLSASYNQPVSVTYSTAENSALAGSDYQSQTATLTFAPGETSKIVSIAVLGDRAGEYDETFFVKLTSPVNSFVADGSGTGAIHDDEPYAWIYNNSITEGDDGTKSLAFTVTLSAAYDVDVTVDYATLAMSEEEAYYNYGISPATAGADYTPTTGTVTIAKGQTTAMINIPIIGDRVPEGTEGFFVQLTGSNFANASGLGVGTIMDNEPQAYLSTYPYASAPEGNTGTSPMTFTVVLSNAYDLPVTVSFTTTDGSALAGSDYVATTGSVTFNPGQTSQTIVVPIIGDTAVEYDEYLGVNLTAATNATFLTGSAIGYILDDDIPPAISIGDASLVEGNSGTKLMTFVVSLSKPSGQGISVNFATVNGTAKTSDSDYVAQSGSLYFAPGQTSQTIQIVIKGDTRKEQNETFQVKLTGASGASISDSQGTGTITNDDGGGKGNGKLSSAAATDAALTDLFTPTSKKRR